MNQDKKYISPLHKMEEEYYKAERDFRDEYYNLKKNYIEKFGEEEADKKLEKHKKFGDYHRDLKRQYEAMKEEEQRKIREEEEERKKYIEFETWEDFVKHCEKFESLEEQLLYLNNFLKYLKQKLIDNETDQEVKRWIKKLEIEIPYKKELLSLRENTAAETGSLKNEQKKPSNGLSSTTSQFVFNRKGDHWKIIFNGQNLPDYNHTDGFSYIHCLLDHARQRIRADVLYDLVKKRSATRQSSYEDYTPHEEKELIKYQVEYGQADLHYGEPLEQIDKARKNITNIITGVTNKLWKDNEDAGRYFSNTIKRGKYFSYDPSLGNPQNISWAL